MELTHLRLTRRTNLRALLGGSAAAATASALTLAPQLARTGLASHGPPHVPIAGSGPLGTFAGDFAVNRFRAE